MCICLKTGSYCLHVTIPFGTVRLWHWAIGPYCSTTIPNHNHDGQLYLLYETWSDTCYTGIVLYRWQAGSVPACVCLYRNTAAHWLAPFATIHATPLTATLLRVLLISLNGLMAIHLKVTFSYIILYYMYRWCISFCCQKYITVIYSFTVIIIILF